MSEERKIKNVDRKPCGCVITEFEDGGKEYSPCPPHGLYRVAESLQKASDGFDEDDTAKAAAWIKDAGMALAAVASVLQAEQRKAMQRSGIAAAVEKAMSDTQKMDEEGS